MDSFWLLHTLRCARATRMQGTLLLVFPRINVLFVAIMSWNRNTSWFWLLSIRTLITQPHKSALCDWLTRKFVVPNLSRDVLVWTSIHTEWIVLHQILLKLTFLHLGNLAPKRWLIFLIFFRSEQFEVWPPALKATKRELVCFSLRSAKWGEYLCPDRPIKSAMKQMGNGSGLLELQKSPVWFAAGERNKDSSASGLVRIGHKALH